MVLLLASGFWQKLEQWDQELFLKINTKWTNPFFDAVLPYFRDSVFWAPLYLFILAFIFLNYGKKGAWWSVAFLCTVAIADIVSSRFFKEYFERLRPCQDPFFMQNVRLLLKHCSGSYSFTSSHAANHFGLAMFLYATLKKHFGNWMWLFFAWAFVIGYAQVYIGVHYPFDILGGAVFGCLVGYGTAYVVNRIVKEKHSVTV
jgi:undecaprenyl-diphosphatase